MTFFIRFDLITVLQSPLIFIKSKRLIGCGGHYLRARATSARLLNTYMQIARCPRSLWKHCFACCCWSMGFYVCGRNTHVHYHASLSSDPTHAHYSTSLRIPRQTAKNGILTFREEIGHHNLFLQNKNK